MPRTPLASISGNRRRGPELTPYRRGEIVGKYNAGVTRQNIAHILETPKSTIDYTIDQASKRPHGESRPRTGRPPKLSDRDKRHLIRVTRMDPRATYARLKLQCGLNCSTDTIYRVLKEYGLTNWLAKKRPLLSPEVAVKRLAWCLERRHWRYEDWLKIIWSDECSVERGSGKERQWVFRFPHEKWDKEMIQPYPKRKGVSVMVWAAFVGKEQSNLVRVARDPDAKKNGYTAASYVDLLEEEIPTMWEPGLLFMQDNAPIHTARIVREWLEENGIDVLEWPPYSPDLNPIEHLWFRLKNLVYQVNPDIEKVGGSADTVREALFKALERAWTMIPEDLMLDLLRSMQRRVEAVIVADGWYTRY